MTYTTTPDWSLWWESHPADAVYVARFGGARAPYSHRRRFERHLAALIALLTQLAARFVWPYRLETT